MAIRANISGSSPEETGRATRRRAAHCRVTAWTAGGYTVAALLALVNGVHAQDALFSALSIDRAIAPPQTAPASAPQDQPHLGPIQFSYGLYTGVEYNDNINSSQFDPLPAISLRGGVNLALAWTATESSALQLSASIGYLHDIENNELGGLEVSPDSALTYQIGFRDGTVSWFNQLSYLRQVTQEPALVNVAELPRLDNTVGARVEWEPGRWDLQAGYSHDIYLSTSSLYHYLDRSSEYFFTRDGWRFAENTQAGLEASGSLTDYAQSSQSDSQSVSAGAYADWQMTQAVHATVRGGPTIYFFNSAGAGMPVATALGTNGAGGVIYADGLPPGGTPGSTLPAYYLELTLSDQLTDHFTHSISVKRDISLGINQGSQYIEQLTTDYSFSWQFTPRVRLMGDASYLTGNQPLPTFSGSVQENFRSFAGGPALVWQMTDHSSCNLKYSWGQRLSNLFGRDYTQQIVSLNLSHTFR